MTKRLLIAAVLTVLVWPLVGQNANAQERLEDVWFVRSHVGVTSYLGDNEGGWLDDDQLYGTPLSVAFAFGRQLSPKFGLSAGYRYGKYAQINNFRGWGRVGVDEAESVRHAIEFKARYNLTNGKLAPFVFGGANIGFGNTLVFASPLCTVPESPTCTLDTTNLVAGPTFGIGLDLHLSKNFSLVAETGFNAQGPDESPDGRKNGLYGATDDGFKGPMDLLGWSAFGFKYDFKAFTPVVVGDLICPTETVMTGSPTNFAASVNEDATQPVTTTWDFGDGSTATGLTASHAFAAAGRYNVTFSAANGKSNISSSKTCAVTVEDPCAPAEIVTMNASTMSPDTRTSVSFSSNVSGTSPVSYRWDFGDGSTATTASGSHTYSTPGTYTVTLSATNCGGTVERTMTVTVVRYEAAICSTITEMNSVFFDRNSSTLTAEGRVLLKENLDILLECPNLNARVEGWSAPGERRVQELSAARAAAVEQYYVDNGVSASRLVSVGMGRTEGMASRKEGLSQFRRADTIPVRN